MSSTIMARWRAVKESIPSAVMHAVECAEEARSIVARECGQTMGHSVSSGSVRLTPGHHEGDTLVDVGWCLYGKRMFSSSGDLVVSSIGPRCTSTVVDHHWPSSLGEAERWLAAIRSVTTGGIIADWETAQAPP